MNFYGATTFPGLEFNPMLFLGLIKTNEKICHCDLITWKSMRFFNMSFSFF